MGARFFYFAKKLSVIIFAVPMSQQFRVYVLFCDAEGRPLDRTRLISEGLVGVFVIIFLATSLNLQSSPLPIGFGLLPECKQEVLPKQPRIPSHDENHLEVSTSSTAFSAILPILR